jgi:hypothetical protein
MTGWGLSGLFKRSASTRTQFGMPNVLSGTFELRVDRLVGSVEDIYGSRPASLLIDVYHRNVVVVSCPATARPERSKFDFSIPVEGLFTGAELVREDVFLMARDSDGNTGRLRLDGAAQIELVREYLGVPASVILDVDFSRGGNSRPYLGAGWSGAEADFTWTEGDDSFVNFNAPTEPGTYVLRMTAGAFVTKPALSAQEMAVFVNTTHVGHIVSTEYHPQFQECKFQHEAFAGGPRTTLRLHHADAARPCDIGSNPDSRRLAFSFKRLTLVRLLPPNDDAGAPQTQDA